MPDDKKKLTAWDRVSLARNAKRPTALDYINIIFDDFLELHGDRLYSDDGAMVCGLAAIGKQNFTIIAEQKGRNTKENIKRNFGMPNPESYRKAIRLMKQAEKFNRPIVTFIDTKGAYPGIEAEQRGQGEAIAKSMMEMANLKTPIICIVIGEGSSRWRARDWRRRRNRYAGKCRIFRAFPRRVFKYFVERWQTRQRSCRENENDSTGFEKVKSD